VVSETLKVSKKVTLIIKQINLRNWIWFSLFRSRVSKTVFGTLDPWSIYSHIWQWDWYNWTLLAIFCSACQSDSFKRNWNASFCQAWNLKEPWCQFHQHSLSSFYARRSRKRKKIRLSHQYLFTLLG